LVIALLILALIGAIYQAIATELDERAFPPPGQLIDVGGHRLHINCIGQGSPTVILEAANLGMSANWVRVQRQVAQTTRVCAYISLQGLYGPEGHLVVGRKDGVQIGVGLQEVLHRAHRLEPVEVCFDFTDDLDVCVLYGLSHSGLPLVAWDPSQGCPL